MTRQPTFAGRERTELDLFLTTVAIAVFSTILVLACGIGVSLTWSFLYPSAALPFWVACILGGGAFSLCCFTFWAAMAMFPVEAGDKP